MKHTFPVKLRLRYKADFRALRNGQRFACHSLRFTFAPNQKQYSRLGFAVSRRYGKAVQRNRFKRKLRNIFRCHPVKEIGVDILVIPRIPYQEGLHIGEDMRNGLDKIYHCMKGDRG